MTLGIKTANVARINGFNIYLGTVDDLLQPVVTADYLDNLTVRSPKDNTFNSYTAAYSLLDSTYLYEDSVERADSDVSFHTDRDGLFVTKGGKRVNADGPANGQ